MNLQRFSIFENDVPLGEQVKDSVKKIGEKPSKFCLLFRVFWLQICLAVFCLITCILLPYFILYA